MNNDAKKKSKDTVKKEAKKVYWQEDCQEKAKSDTNLTPLEHEKSLKGAYKSSLVSGF